MLSGPQSSNGHFGEEINLLHLRGFEPQNHRTHSIVTIVIRLSQLLKINRKFIISTICRPPLIKLQDRGSSWGHFFHDTQLNITNNMYQERNIPLRPHLHQWLHQFHPGLSRDWLAFHLFVFVGVLTCPSAAAIQMR